MGLTSDFLGGVVGNLNAGSAIANGVSFAAQGRASDFNSQMMANQQAYNSAAAAQQVAYNKDLWAQAAKYNAEQAAYANQLDQSRWEDYKSFQAEQAQLNRDFQERMSNTAYQRAVTDMMKAGINPILAAQVGGATTPGGATASIGMPSGKMASMGSASAGLPSSGMASVGGFTGQGNNMSEQLAMFGAIASMFGDALSGLGNISLSFEGIDNLIKQFNEGDSGFKDGTGEKMTYKEKFDELAQNAGKGVFKAIDKFFSTKSKYGANQEGNRPIPSAGDALGGAVKKWLKQYNY